MAPFQVSRLEPELAAQMLAGCAHLDPRGIACEADIPGMAARNQCFAVTGDGGAQAVYLVRVINGVAWVDAAHGSGPADWTGLLLPLIERQAPGLPVRFQTGRPGLVRRALRQGYQVRGWILGKDPK